MIAKVLFVLCSYALHFYLGRFLGPKQYGIVGIIITIININYILLNNGIRQAISKLIAQKVFLLKGVIKKGMIAQVALGLIIGILNYSFAPLIGNLLKDPSLTKYIEMASFIVPFTAIYFGLVGVLNGLKLFKLEAIILSIYPILRLSVIPLSTVMKEDMIIGVIIGFFFASFLISLIAGVLTMNSVKKQTTKGQRAMSMPVLVRNSIPLIVFFSGITLLMNIDIIFLKRITMSNYSTGIYTAIVTLRQTPYFLASSFYLVMLPLVSDFYQNNRMEEAKRTVSVTIDIVTASILPLVIMLSSSSELVLRFFYSSEYVEGKTALAILMFGIYFLVMAIIFNIVLNSVNKQKYSTIIVLALLVIDVLACIFLIGPLGMNGAALATTSTAFIGMIVSYVFVLKYLGSTINKKITFKLMMVLAVLSIICIVTYKYIIITSLLQLAVSYLVIGFMYLIIIHKIGILKIEDILKLLKLKKRKEPNNE